MTVNTGFTDYITLPVETVRRLGLAWQTTKEVFLAGDQKTEFKSFYGMVELDGERFQVEMYQMDGPPLVGMALLTRFRLTVEVTTGGAVTVERLP